MDTAVVRRQLALMDLLRRLPPDAPFTTAHAKACGLSLVHLRLLVADGLLVRPLRGVYHLASIADCTALRVAVVRLVTPEAAVVTDRTAAWVLGGEHVLEPGAHLVVPQVTMFCLPGSRLRNKLVDSGQRMLRPEDIEVIGGLRVTTPLRTACDVGRLLHRDQAIGVMDALAALGQFTVEQLVAEVDRFKGFRGVRQLAPVVDRKSGSPGEGTMRLRWLDAGLPKPECQVEVPAPGGGSYFIDMGLPDRKLGGEYFGEEFHGEDAEEHDEARLDWLRTAEDWTIVVARKHNVYGHAQDVDGLLVAAARECGVLPSR
jgi:hypothetical protein